MFSCKVFLLIKFSVVYSFSNLQDYSADDSELQNCVCVPYWQCKEDFSGLIEDEIDVVNIRLLHNATYTEPPCTGDFDVCCKIECGKKRNIPDVDSRMFSSSSFNNEIGYRIIGADNDAEFGEFPWMLGVLDGKKYKCGASLIHPKVAITAAHCVSGKRPYKVRAGEWDWESKTEPMPHQDRNTKKIIIHPQYHAGSLRNDIAILFLDRAFRLSENVGVMCLPRKSLNLDYKNCIATGWGKNSFEKGSYQSTLKKVTLPIVRRESCLKSLQMARLGPMFNLHRSFICAGGIQNKDTCKGDGGSPLICPVEGEPHRYEQVGIVSWGLTCGLMNTPGVYVNVALFIDWIDNKLQQYGLDTNVYKY